MTTAQPPRTQTEPAPPRPPVNGSDDTAFGDLVSFRAQEHPVLRAEHLAVMQTYAAELAMAVGVGTGSGIVSGFRPDIIDNAAIEVGPGLAIDPAGRVLYSTESTAVIDLTVPRPVVQDGFWVLEIRPASQAFGAEPVFGNLCDDPCAGSTVLPWTAEGVVVALREDTLSGLDANSSSLHRRSWLASAYFERERRRSGPLIVPAGPAPASRPGR